MNLLIITNIYPPQDLGGMDGLLLISRGAQNRGHRVQVLTSNAPELGTASKVGPSSEPIDRSFKLKGSYSGGVKHMNDQRKRRETDEHNAKRIRQWLEKKCWDGILLGNIDLRSRIDTRTSRESARSNIILVLFIHHFHQMHGQCQANTRWWLHLKQ